MARNKTGNSHNTYEHCRGEDEMVGLLSNLLDIPTGRCRDWFHKADGNRDGVVQVHEFIAWLTDNPPFSRVFENEKDGKKTVDAWFVFLSVSIFFAKMLHCFPPQPQAMNEKAPSANLSSNLEAIMTHLEKPNLYGLRM